jgi:hypothetical protein
LRQYNEEIDKTIIEVLYKKGERAFGKLKEDVEKSIKHTISFETYSYRLNAMLKPYAKESRYTIQQILQKRDEGRGKNVFYSLTRDAKIRTDLRLPILKSDTIIEKAYRLLFYYIVFHYTPSISLKDDIEYIALLEKFHIKENELESGGKAVFDEFKIMKWTHAKSEIEITRKDFLQPSGKEGRYEYSYMLPGISPTEFHDISERGLPYQKLKITKDEIKLSFRLLENQNLIKIIPYYLEFLNQERYVIVDNSLRELLADCWTLQSHVFTYLEYCWQSMSKPTNKEKIWFERLWGKNRTNKWFMYCHNIRKEYQIENRNQLLKETKERIEWEKSEIIKKFESIKKDHAKTINDYSYFINPLLNVIYPEFLRSELNKITNT